MSELSLRCKNCGAFISRVKTVDYKGGKVHLQLELNCVNRRCRAVNVYDVFIRPPAAKQSKREPPFVGGEGIYEKTLA